MEELDSLLKIALSEHSYEKQLSLKIRVKLVQIFRSIEHYGTHLNCLKDVVQTIPRVTYYENRFSSELTEHELEVDSHRKEEELEVLGSIGFKNVKETYYKYPDAIMRIRETTKESCQKLYSGENAKDLTGPERSPHYLSVFLSKMVKQAEEFQIN